MQLLLLSRDLTIQSAVQGTANHLGLRLTVCMSTEQLIEKVAQEPAGGVILDLETPKLDIREVVSRLRENHHPPARVIAFGPHVHESLLESAKQAGCDLVLSRGQFHRQMIEILGGLRGE